MKITLEETEFRIQANRNEQQLVHIIVDNVASYIDPNYVFKRKVLLDRFKNNAYLRNRWEKWSGKEDLYRRYKDTWIVNAGLLKPFLRSCVLFDLEWEMTDLRELTKNAQQIIFDDRIQLYDYQEDLVKVIQENDGCGIISAPTGSGKTIVGTELTAILGNTPTIIIADKVNILKQWQETYEDKRKSNLKFKKFGSVYVGFIGEEARILLCTSIFLAKHYKISKPLKKEVLYIINNCGMIIYDEVHRAGSESGITVLDSCQARYRIGLSGTVNKRSDGKDLEYISRIGQIIAHIKSSTLIDKEKIVPIDIYFKPVRKVGSRRMDYQQSYRACITENSDRNERITQQIIDFMDKDMKFIIFVDYILHAQEINSYSGVVYTDSKDKNRNKKFDDLRSGAINGLICTYDLAGLGFDLPALDGLIFAGAGKSAIKFIQAKGRISRIFEDKERGIIIDFADTSKYFDAHALERYKIYAGELGVNLYSKGTWLHGK